ncbi:hypothetical protein POM88_025769 [Heracleum sosnowskyi]|uniref:Uncharacterized protein n=1 Tax=Heracleum sosnowskyi TaxID=360622 RepID=A0AAD8I5M1_9APIA|nr:hypothetical protein POM88_025769 [Heracleum sosnowskyi]
MKILAVNYPTHKHTSIHTFTHKLHSIHTDSFSPTLTEFSCLQLTAIEKEPTHTTTTNRKELRQSGVEIKKDVTSSYRSPVPKPTCNNLLKQSSNAAAPGSVATYLALREIQKQKATAPTIEDVPEMNLEETAHEVVNAEATVEIHSGYYWGDEEVQSLADDNATRHSTFIETHTLGPKTLVQCRYKMKKKDPKHASPSNAKVYVKSRK